MKRAVPLLLAALAALVSQGAAADKLKYEGAKFGSFDGSYTIHDSSPTSITINKVSAGAFKMEDLTGGQDTKNATFAAWCVDIYDPMNTSSSGVAYNRVEGNTFYSAAPTIDKDLERLASYVFDNSTSNFTKSSWGSAAVQSAAFQLAIWEIVDDKAGHGNYDIYHGDFYASGGDAKALTLAQSWLTWLNSSASINYNIDQDLQIWQQTPQQRTQNLAVFVPVVPEPQTYAMLAAGLGLLTFMGWQRRRTLKAAKA